MATDETPAADTPAPEPEAAAPEGEFDAAVAVMYGDDPPAPAAEPGAPGELPAAPPEGEPEAPDAKPPEGAPEPPEAQAAPPEPDAKQERWDKLVEVEKGKRAAQRDARNLVDMADLRARAETDPIAVAEELGITYGALLEHLTAGTPEAPATGEAKATGADSEVLARLARIEAAQKARDERYEQDTQQTAERAELGTIAQMVGARPACKAFESEAVPLARETAKQLCQQAGITATPEILPTVYAEALDRVEAYIANREVTRLEQQRLIPSVAARLGAVPQTPGVPATAPAATSGPTIGGGEAATAAPREKTDEELFDDAVEAMYS